MAKVQKKSFVCNFTPNILCLVILLVHQSNLVSSRLPNYTNIMLTRWLTLEGRCCLISQKRQVGVGYWHAKSTLREHNCNYSRDFIIIIVIIIIIIIILPFEELPFYHIKVIFCNVQN